MTGRVAPGPAPAGPAGSGAIGRAFDTDEPAFDPSAGGFRLRDEPDHSGRVLQITRSAVADADAARIDHR